MIDRFIRKECTGCTACQCICPHNAIEMAADIEGFLYPSVDYQKCLQCKLCVSTCHVLSGSMEGYEEPVVYAGWNKTKEIRLNSTSGGVFSAIADAVIERGGYVVGAAYDENHDIYHLIIHDHEGIVKLRQSKYAQSNLGSVFKEVKKLLIEGNLVLFCGTPCQSAGLQKYLRKRYTKLYCCDFICRGVISPKVYHKYLDCKANEYKSNISKVHFKNKDYGWNSFSTKIYFENGTYYQQDRYHDLYMKGYLNYNLYIRPACHDCSYKKIPRSSDISLGDFWGIGKYDKSLDSDQGTSVILVNSEKGREILQWIRDALVLEKRNIDEVLNGNSCLLNSVPEGKYREYFFRNIDKVSFDKIISTIENKATQRSIMKKVLMEISGRIPHIGRK